MVGTGATSNLYDVVVVGAGAAGVGVAVALRHAGVKGLLVVDRSEVGASFAAWPAETRFITPSFPTNSIGMLDLNSVAIGTSPAVTVGVEHPSGADYAMYLRRVARYFELPVCRQTDVLGVTRSDGVFHLNLAEGNLRTKHLVWAAGEFQYPHINGLPGAEHCRHTATVARYGDLDGDNFVVIGGYESGIDAAYHLAVHGKHIQLFDKGCPWRSETTDPSVALSTYSLERMNDSRFIDRVELNPHTPVASVARKGTGYTVSLLDRPQVQTRMPPLYAGGFQGGHQLVADLFERRDDSFPLLNENDESTIKPGLFLCGPAVRHGSQSFCFIYKYRQRFAVVAKAIATTLGLAADELDHYRKWGMYLDDLSVCGQECEC